uniref:Cardiotrophin-like cytokine factor 1 n=1 Tax=Cyprinus carpio TaxID=7962 RepID=A0A8C1GNS0_CYPCA
MVDASKYDLQIKKRINNTRDDPVCRVKYGSMRMSQCDLYNNRTEVSVIDGTVIIKRVIRADSGNYRLILVHSNGTETSRDLPVIVEAPIGSVEVSISCSSNQRSVSCSSDGDHIIYSWTLNGEILEQGPMNGNTTIQLNEGTDGDISCSVKNHVSHTQKNIRLKHCPGLDRFCSFGQSDPCYVALGDKLNLLMVDASKYDLQIKKRINNNTADGPVCRVKNDSMRMSQCDLYNNRPEVSVINGTVIINCVIRADSGNYRLILTDSDGTDTSRDLQVIVEAPIGSVEVSVICSSNQRSVSCSSDGDHIMYSWTLNGEILEQGPMNGNTTIQLNEGTDGDISCSVKNHVSHAQKTIRLKPCPGPTTAAVTSSLTSTSTQTPEYGTSFSSADTIQTQTQSPEEFLRMFLEFSLIALGCVALILILLFITICYVYKKKQLKSTQVPAGDTELIYADISHEKKSEKKNTESFLAADVEYSEVRTQTKRKKKKKEEEVQYGEVTFTPNHSNAPQQQLQEECVYSQNSFKTSERINGSERNQGFATIKMHRITRRVDQVAVLLLLLAAVGFAQVLDRTLILSHERSSIERTYELTKYLDHQLKEIRDTYLSYLGPPFSDPGFSPPRPNSSALSVPSAATRVDLWRGLENGARLAQNQRAYSVLLCAVRELARSTLCPYLQSSLLHFCSGLSGLLGSISGLMNALGYTNLPPSTPAQGYAPLLSSQFQGESENSPAPLRSYEPRGIQPASGVREGTTRADLKRDRERSRRGRRKEGESWAAAEEGEKEEGMERWGKRRRLLSLDEEKTIQLNMNYTALKFGDGYRKHPVLFSSPSLQHRRPVRSIPSSHAGLSPLSLLYQYGGPVAEVHSLLAAPVLSSRPAPNDFSRKVEGFWVLRELQSWLWRSAKDFTRLKKRLRV